MNNGTVNGLVEHLISHLLDEAAFPVQQLDKAERVLGLPKENIVNTVEQFDPTPTKDYSVWILKQWMFKNIILPEDGHRVLTTLTHYDQNKRKARSNLERDINRYRTIHDLEIALEEEIPALKTTAVEVGQQVKDLQGVTVVKRVPPDLVVLKVEDPDSLATLGEGTKWCTRRSYPNCQAKSYIDDYGYVYVVLKQGKPFVQYTPNYEQIKDADNEDFEDIEVLKQIIMPPRVLTLFTAYYYSTVSGKRYPPGEPIIAKDPARAVKYAELFLGGERWPEAEPAIINSEWLDRYIRYLKHRSHAIEKSILRKKKAPLMVNYAKYVIKDCWREAEPFIAKDPSWSLIYARNLGRRFPAGEEAILNSKDNFLKVNYAKEVIGGRWPEAEPFIANSPEASLAYAGNINRRFPAGEKIILKKGKPRMMVDYAKNVIGGRWPEAEPIIAKNDLASYHYATEVVKGRFAEGERAIKKYLYLWNDYQKYLASVSGP